MDIKQTEFTASSQKIEITDSDSSVKIVEENVQVNVVESAVSVGPSADDALPEEVFFTEAALMEPSSGKDSEEESAADKEEDSSDEMLFTEAAIFEPLPEEAAEEDSDAEISDDKAQIKAVAGLEARKAGAVAAAGLQALAAAMEKRESGAVEQPARNYETFADLEAVERMAIEMVKKEQAAKQSSAAPAAGTVETAPADEAAAKAVETEAPVGDAAETEALTTEAPEADAAMSPGQAECPGCPAAAPACPADAPCGAYAPEETAVLVAEAEAEATAEAKATGEAKASAEAGKASAAETNPVPETNPQPKNKAPRSNATVRVIGVRFRTAGKVYYFDPGQWEVHHGTHVIVETVRGIEYGTVVGVPMDVNPGKVPQPLKEVIRVATPKDTETEQRNRLKEKEAYRVCQEKIRAHGLDMKLINAEYTFDNSKVLFYFTADGRVDFRDLVKDLASVFRTRIELRQIGVRDETKILGGYGICGRPLCCHSWMSDFIPVSIKMAKEQNLSLNPGKISGVCGRLMCCLKNEADTYEELNRNLPRVGDEVQGSDGLSGQVESVNVLRQTIRILVEVDDEKEYHEYHVDDITVLRRRRRGGNRNRKDNTDPKEVQELERLENQDRQPSRDKSDRSKREDRQERRDRGNREERQERGDRANRGDRQDRGERQNREERQDRGERQNREERQDRGERTNRDDRSNRRNNRRRNNSNQNENSNPTEQ